MAHTAPARRPRRRAGALAVVLALIVGGLGLSAGPASAQTDAAAVDAAVWSPTFTLPAGNWVDGVTTTAPGHVWSVGSKKSSDGYYRPYAFRTIDGVTTELPFPADFSTQWGRFISVDGVADDDIWAAGLLIGKTSGAGSGLLGHWDGTAWEQVPLPGVVSEVVSVSARSATDVWFAGNGGDFGATQVYHWNGRAVLPVAVTVADPICSPALTVSVDLTTTANAVWLATRCQLNSDARTAGSVQVLTGRTWRLAYSTGPSGGLVSIADNGAGTVLATGFKPVFGGSLPILVAGRSTLAEVATFAAGDFYWDVAARGSQVYLVGQANSSNASRVLRRNGSTYVPETVNGATPLFGVTIDAAGTAYAVGPAFGGAFFGADVGLYQRQA